MQNIKTWEEDYIELFSTFRNPTIGKQIVIHDLKELEALSIKDNKMDEN